MIKVDAKTMTEREDGIVEVEAIASAEAIGDGKPVAGFYVRRRFHRERFLIAKPEDFSPTWMRFVDVPPGDWEGKIRSNEWVGAKGKEVKRPLTAEEIQEHMAVPELTPLEIQKQRARARANNPMSMREVSDQVAIPNEINTATGQVEPRRSRA